MKAAKAWAKFVGRSSRKDAANARSFEQLKRIQDVLEMAGSELKVKVAHEVGGALYELAEVNARLGKNPNGRAWKKLKSSRKGVVALRWMASSLRLVQTTRGFEISSTIDHAIFHNSGARRRTTPSGKPSKWRLPVRRTLPKKVLPAQWRKIVVDASHEALYGLVRERRATALS